jgi:hypothetical protein
MFGRERFITVPKNRNKTVGAENFLPIDFNAFGAD